MSEEQYVCAVSGVAADAADDGEMPVGWAQITILVRTENTEWNEIQQAKAALVEQQLSLVPEDKREEARPLAAIFGKANFAALEAQTPRFLVEEHEVHVSAEQLGGLMEMLGIEAAE